MADPGHRTRSSAARRSPVPRALLLLAVAPLLLTACPDDTEDIPEAERIEVIPQGGLGEPVVYQGGVDTEQPWRLVITVTDFECDIDIGEDIAIEPGNERFCVARLQAENTGEHPNTTSLVESSAVQGEEGPAFPVNEMATDQYRDERDLGLPLIEPGEQAEKALVFDVADDVDPIYLHLRATVMDPIVTIDLRS